MAAIVYKNQLTCYQLGVFQWLLQFNPAILFNGHYILLLNLANILLHMIAVFNPEKPFQLYKGL